MAIKRIEYENLDLIVASIAVSFKSKPSTNVLVLSELIRLSKHARVNHSYNLAPYISERLKITKESYRAAISKLYKMKLITREGDIIYLSPIVRTPFDEIVITKPEKK